MAMYLQKWRIVLVALPVALAVVLLVALLVALLMAILKRKLDMTRLR
jgi:hypothetical protein